MKWLRKYSFYVVLDLGQALECHFIRALDSIRPKKMEYV